MTKLRAKMIRELELQRKSPHTIKAYTIAVSQLARHFNRSPELITLEEVREYAHHLITTKRLSHASVNVKLAGFLFFYRQVLGRDDFDLKIYNKRSGRLPEPFSRQEIQQILDAASTLKQRMMFMAAYAGGLRSSEVVSLQVKDIDSQRMLIHVRHGKGDKDRFTLLSQAFLQELRGYWSIDRPALWLFPGKCGGHYHAGSLQSAFKKARTTAGVQRAGGIHQLRHAFATHLLEGGLDLITIKRLMGHTSMKTTSRYLHVTSHHVQGIRSPLDLLPRPEDGPIANPEDDQRRQ